MSEKGLRQVYPPVKAGVENGFFWAWFVFFAQIPFVFWYAQGEPALHPIVVMLPLVGLLNYRLEQRGREGLGLYLVRPGRALVLASIFAGLSFIGWLAAAYLEGLSLRHRVLSSQTGWSLVESFLVGVFIIALWEELINRGYIQTRLQAAWGFWGVIVASLLFASMHFLPAWLEYGRDFPKAFLCCVEAGLVGFALGYIYWKSGSVLTTIMIHGANNFAVGAWLLLSEVTPQQLAFSQPSFLLVYLVGQVGVTLGLYGLLFRERRGRGDLVRVSGEKHRKPENNPGFMGSSFQAGDDREL